MLRHRVSRITLCPLAGPKKAIGQESPIGPWLATLQPPLLMSFREPNGAVMTANMKLLGWERSIGASSLRGLQGRSATDQSGQAAEEKKTKVVPGWMQPKHFWLPAQGVGVFRLTSPFIGLPSSPFTRGQSPGLSTNQICGPSGSLVRRTIRISTLLSDRRAWLTNC